MADSPDPVAKLKTACEKGYDSNPGSCSNAVWDVIKAIVNPDERYRMANEMVDWMRSEWRSVSLDEAFELANKGTVVVGGTKSDTGHGHVIVVYPGTKKQNGGYPYFWKKENKTLVMKATGFYPRAMSTSMGQWPGARSRGDKTVWDPWGSDEAFDDVEFWAPKC